MKVAIIAPGPIRSFSLCYQSWVDNLILPLENRIGKGNVKIFMDNSIITDNIFDKDLKNSVFTTKLGIDTDGWQNIIKNSPYIAQHTTYKYNDQYIENIFTKINNFNGTSYDPYSLKKHTTLYTKKNNYKYKFYYMLIQGICLNYNNKKAIDKIPEDYDITIKIRPDAFLVNPYPINDIINIKNNTIYLQAKISSHNNPSFKLLNKKYLLGKRWDNFYMAHTSTLKQLYQKLYYHFSKNIHKFIQQPNKQNECIPEFLLKNIILSEKITVDKYLYHGAADKRFNIAKEKKMNLIDFAKKNKFNWFVFKDKNCNIMSLTEHYSK